MAPGKAEKASASRTALSMSGKGILTGAGDGAEVTVNKTAGSVESTVNIR